MIRIGIAALCLSLVAASAPAAEEAPARVKKLLGGWERDAGGSTVTFQFAADRLLIKVEAGGAGLDVAADYGVTKDGIVFGIVTKVDKKGDIEAPAVGDLFRFHFAPDKDKAVLKELKGPQGEAAKQTLEGDYKRQAEKE